MRSGLRASYAGSLVAVIVTACAPPVAGELKGAPTPVRVPAAVLPPAHGKVTFRWEYRDRDVLARGEGRALVAPPDSVRLDFQVAGGMGSGFAWLFGDTVVSGGGGGSARVKRYLPPPVLLWAALGRFQVSAPDTTVRLDGDTLRADLRLGDVDTAKSTVWRVAFADAKLVGLERLLAGRVRETVVRRKNGDIKFDNPSAGRSLTLTHVRSDTVAEIDPELWHR